MYSRAKEGARLWALLRRGAVIADLTVALSFSVRLRRDALPFASLASPPRRPSQRTTVPATPSATFSGHTLATRASTSSHMTEVLASCIDSRSTTPSG